MTDSNDSDLAKDIGNEALQLAKDIPVLGHILKWGDAFVQVRRKHAARNLTEFFRLIARGEDVMKDPRFWDKVANQFEASDFANLAEAVAREDEEEKISVYANLYRAFVHNEVTDPVLRRHMIKAAREMTKDEADLVRKIYEAWDFPEPQDHDDAVQKLSKDLLGSHRNTNSGQLSLAKLQGLGFIEVIVGGWNEQRPSLCTSHILGAFRQSCLRNQ